MKNLILSFSLAMTLVCSTVVLNYIYPVESEHVATEMGDDLSTDNGLLYDMVFDGQGNLLSETTYRWNAKEDTKGDIVNRTTVSLYETLVCNK